MSSSVLRDWFLGGVRSSPPLVAVTSSSLSSSSSLPRILLLDGGVSTHLQSLGATFQYREFWSSSLLLPLEKQDNDDDTNSTKNKNRYAGHAWIRQGHEDWLSAGANIVSTVTYQCFYEPQFWPKTVLSSTSSSTTSSLKMNDEIMDQMWRDGLKLAREAIENYEKRQQQQQQQEASSSSANNNNNTMKSRPHFVLASSGCYGAAMANGEEYTGAYGTATRADIKRFHCRKLQAIVALSKEQQQQEAPDGIALETIPSLEECHALRELLLDDNPEVNPLIVVERDNNNSSSNNNNNNNTNNNSNNLACYISLACRDGAHLNDGTPLAKALQVLLSVPANRLHAIGLNCCDSTHLPSLLDILVREMVVATTAAAAAAVVADKKKAETSMNSNTNSSDNKQQRGIVLYPNSGEMYDGVTGTWKEGTGCRDDSSSMAKRLIQCVQQIDGLWHELCPSDPLLLPSILLGGCCRTTPDTIVALRAAIDAYLEAEALSL